LKRAENGNIEGRSLLLARMAATRSELTASSKVMQPVLGATRSRVIASAGAGPLFLRSPYAELLAALLIGSTILGPRNMAATALRAALIPWIRRTIGAAVA
jgi:hypothetical protein